MPVEGETFLARWGVPPPSPDPSAVPPASLDALRSAVSALTRASGAPVFVSKRIANNWRIPLLAAAFPSARFVEIVRDGRAVAYSLSRVDWWEDSELVWIGGTPRGWQDQGMDPWELCARNWVAEMEAVTAGMAAVPAEQKLRIVYEDLVASPLPTLGAVADFAGLPAQHDRWQRNLQGLRFPDRNEVWRTRLDADVVARIEGFQAEELWRNGYAMGAGAGRTG